MDYNTKSIILGMAGMLANEEARMRRYIEERRHYRVGKLVIRKRRGNLYYSELIDRRERGITCNPERLNKVIRGNQLDLLIACSKENIRVLEESIAQINQYAVKVDDSFTRLQGERQGYSPDDWQWMRAPFRSNPAYSEDLQYVSGLGTTVRTKSELNIVNALEAAGIPYRYEMETMVLGKAIYPDFTIKKADGRKVIWEHYGMTHDEDYAKKAEIRSINYEKSGYRRHTNFIVTYESDIKDRQEIDKIIRRFILF